MDTDCGRVRPAYRGDRRPVPVRRGGGRLDTSLAPTLIRAALEKLQAQEVYRVRVHPEHQLVLRACLEESGRGGNIEVLSDPLQARGGAVFEMSRGSLDASVETQLREIERGLVDQLQERP